MKYSKENIIMALTIIKEECESHEDCEDCPFVSDDESCLIYDNFPDDWQINTLENVVWKGLI